jgi:protein-arginine deiminase
MKKLVSALLFSFILVGFASSVAYSAPNPSQVKRIKFINNNHIPQKILVVLNNTNRKFVKDLFDITKLINESEGLSGSNLIKLHIVSSGGDPISILGISKSDAEKYVEVNPNFSTSDIWMQDCMELCAAETHDGKMIPAVFDSNRGRGLARLPKVLSDMWDLVYYKNPSRAADHGDYGGNLEVTPFDDILVVGDTITKECYNYLSNHGYKDRIYVGPASWLQVGHIDEYLSFIPTPAAPGGYTIVRADPTLALDIIKNSPDSELQKASAYDRSFLLRLKATLNSQLKDPNAGKGTPEGDFIALNYQINDLIEEGVGKLKDFIRTTTGDSRRDFEEVSWPSLFKGYGAGSSYPSRCHAFLPGVVNMLVIRDHLIVPATHIPTFDKAIEIRLKAQGNKVHFVDDTPYHSLMGEIHCGTNTLRDPNRLFFDKKRIEAVQRVKNQFKKIHNNE